MDPITKLFANSTLVEVLGLFLQSPEEEFYQTEIAQKTQKALMQVQRSLKTLQDIGLISFVKRGKMIYYKAVRDHPAFEDLKRLFFKTVILGDTIRASLLPLKNRIRLAFIFGSVARGEESVESDIDLFLVADISLRDLSKVFGPLSKQLQRELNPVIVGPDEIKKRLLKKDHFLLQVMESPKLWIIGDENEFRSLGKRRKT
jgi:predicted nucleotidyltransferase